MRTATFAAGWMLAAVLLGGTMARSADTPASAYAAQNYNLAAQLLKKAPDTPENRLVAALCNLYDRARPDYERGHKALAVIFDDVDASLPHRLEAGMALARTVQLMKERRDFFGNRADAYDHEKIFREVIALAPGTVHHRTAFMYLIRERLENPETRDAAWPELEAFFRDFPGDQRLVAPVHLLAEYEYVRQAADYPSAVRHLRAGYALGFANPSEERAALFRLGFLTLKRIGDPKAAAEVFKQYLVKHPLSNLAVVAQRFLDEIAAGEAGK